MTVFKFALKRSFRQIINVILLGGLPLVAIFLPVTDMYPLPVGFQFYGLLLFFTSAKLVSIMMDDRIAGTLLRVGVSPVTHFQYLWQNLLAYSSLLTLQSAIVIAGGMLYGHNLGEPVLLFIVYAVFSLTSISFSLAWYALFRNKETAFSVLMGFGILMFMTGGMFWPIEFMTEFIQQFAMILPPYWLAEAQSILTGDGSAADLVVPLMILLLFTFAFLLSGSRRTIA